MEPHTDVKYVVFDMEHSTCELPVFGFTQKRTKSYEVFFQWVLRCGFFPKVSFNLEKGLRSGNPHVIVNPGPDTPFSSQTRRAVQKYLEEGGSLLVLTSPEEPIEAANRILEPYNILFQKQNTLNASLIEPHSNARICSLTKYCSVTGGEPLLKTRTGNAVVSFKKIGKGTLIAAGLAHRFVNTSMGYSTRGIPDAVMRAVYELEFSLLRGLASGEIEAEINSLGKLYAGKKQPK